jgi:hypothetical protein
LDLLTGTKVRSRRAFSGWALDAAITLDEVSPGILRFVTTASVLRRQAVFAVLADVAHEGAEEIAARLRPLLPDGSPLIADHLAAISTVLMTRRVRDITQAIYGPVEGLVGILGRLGDKPLHPGTYRTIVSILSQPEHRTRAKVLRQMEKVAASAPSILLALQSPFILSSVAECFRSVEQVLEFRSAVDLIRRVVPQVTELELAKSIADLGPDARLDDWTIRWINKAECFLVAPPIQDDGELVGLRSAKALRDAGKRYSNCLATKVGPCAVGRYGYAEYLPGAVIEMVSLSQGQWVLNGIYGPNNLPVDTAMAHRVYRKLQAAGVLVPARVAHGKPWNAVARLMGIGVFDGTELEALEEEEPDDLQAAVDELTRAFEAA